jgi:hypothetical protein
MQVHMYVVQPIFCLILIFFWKESSPNFFGYSYLKQNRNVEEPKFRKFAQSGHPDVDTEQENNVTWGADLTKPHFGPKAFRTTFLAWNFIELQATIYLCTWTKYIKCRKTCKCTFVNWGHSEFVESAHGMKVASSISCCCYKRFPEMNTLIPGADFMNIHIDRKRLY